LERHRGVGSGSWSAGCLAVERAMSPA
jgi:hypothetical protein